MIVVQEETARSTTANDRKLNVKYSETRHPYLSNPSTKKSFFDHPATKTIEIGDSKNLINTRSVNKT